MVGSSNGHQNGQVVEVLHEDADQYRTGILVSMNTCSPGDSGALVTTTPTPKPGKTKEFEVQGISTVVGGYNEKAESDEETLIYTVPFKSSVRGLEAQAGVQLSFLEEPSLKLKDVTIEPDYVHQKLNNSHAKTLPVRKKKNVVAKRRHSLPENW